jgi:predicted transporter
MKYIILFLFIAVLASITAGFIMQGQEHPEAQKFIGAGVIGLFFVVMPLFIFHRYKNKSMKEYMLTKENIDKMLDKNK